MLKTYKFKLCRHKKRYNRLQNELFVFCQIYNHSLRLVKEHYRIFGKNPSKNNLQKHLKKLMDRGLKPEWEVLGYSQGIQEVTDRIYRSYQSFFDWAKKRTGPKKSPPKFRPFRKYKSFTLKQAGWKLDEDNKKIKIGPYWYKYHLSRKIQGTVKTITIKRDAVGDWFVCISCESKCFIPDKVLPMTGKRAGFDFGMNSFLMSSKNQETLSPEYLKKSLKELKRRSRNFSKKVKGSKNRVKARKSLARLHRKISNQRLDFHFQESHKILQKYDYVFFEDLNLNGMKQLWGRKVSDLGFSTFLKILEFKAVEQKKTFKRISRFFPSTKMCSSCFHVKEEMPLSQRTFSCSCGNVLSRDLNAAINIEREGASSLGLDEVSRESIPAFVA